ncbi:MAG: DNA translocase FtsK 4TM domain-containing protein, partial [Bacteroides cellulosilyticus]|nr:DNA translocase FtsK 4TM domain-containing protein [Bacteroides cellulosilyticus]
MASVNHKPASPKGPRMEQRTNSDSLRWVGGIVLLFVALFALSAVFFSYFCWAEDQSGLQMSAQDRSALNVTFDNPCGGLGAWIGYWLVDRAFGLFGILIPVMLIVLGVRIIRQRPLLLNHSVLSLVFVMILGSLTLGFCFPKLALISSTGMGGEFGVSVSELLHLHIGTVGTIILLVVGWILTGVFINRNFINTVNAAGNAVVDKSERFVGKMVHTRPVDYSADVELDDSEFADVPRVSRPASEPMTSRPVSKSHASRPVPVRSAEPAQAHREPDFSSEIGRPTEIVRPTTVRRSPDRERYVEEPNPFFDEVPVGGEPEPVVEPAEPQAEPSDELFPEVPRTADASARVVMGRGGLVELERPTPRPARPASAAANSPFVEVAISEDGEPVEPADEQPLADEIAEPDSMFAEEPVPPQPADEIPVAQPAASPDEPSEGVVVTVEANEVRLVDEGQITTESYDPLKDLMNYRKPPVTLLEDYQSDSEVTDEEIFENKTRIEETLKYFGIPIQRIRATVGPTVTLYEIVQAQGVKIAKIQGLQNDIAQSLKAESGIRIIAPIPGRGTIGIEVPNRHKQVVSMYSAIRAQRFQDSKAMLPVVVGRTIQNENYVFDLAKMPHLLVAGATGMGKSVGLNAIITSLLYKMHPAQLKFVMIDPKMVEFSLYA